MAVYDSNGSSLTLGPTAGVMTLGNTNTIYEIQGISADFGDANISTSGEINGGAITSAGLLTAANGLDVTGNMAFNDTNISTTGDIFTNAPGKITSAGRLTASAGLLVVGAAAVFDKGTKLLPGITFADKEDSGIYYDVVKDSTVHVHAGEERMVTFIKRSSLLDNVEVNLIDLAGLTLQKHASLFIDWMLTTSDDNEVQTSVGTTIIAIREVGGVPTHNLLTSLTSITENVGSQTLTWDVNTVTGTATIIAKPNSSLSTGVVQSELSFSVRSLNTGIAMSIYADP
jgi:hypothetical protein